MSKPAGMSVHGFSPAQRVVEQHSRWHKGALSLSVRTTRLPARRAERVQCTVYRCKLVSTASNSCVARGSRLRAPIDQFQFQFPQTRVARRSCHAPSSRGREASSTSPRTRNRRVLWKSERPSPERALELEASATPPTKGRACGHAQKRAAPTRDTESSSHGDVQFTNQVGGIKLVLVIDA